MLLVLLKSLSKPGEVAITEGPLEVLLASFHPIHIALIQRNVDKAAQCIEAREQVCWPGGEEQVKEHHREQRRIRVADLWLQMIITDTSQHRSQHSQERLLGKAAEKFKGNVF